MVAAEGWEEEMEFDWREETDEAKEMVRRFIDGEAGGCRRKVMDEYLDGYTERVGCIIEEEEICDQCRARGGEVHRSRQAATEEASQVGEVMRDHEKEAYQQLERGYSAQRRRFYEAAKGARKVEEEIGFEGEEEVEGGQEVGGEEEVEGEQGPEQFKEEETVNARAEKKVNQLIQRMRGGFRLASGSGCISCGLPFSICTRWEERRAGWFQPKVGGGRCQGRYVAIDVVITGLHLGDRLGFEVRDWMSSEGVPPKDAGREWEGEYKVVRTKRGVVWVKLQPINTSIV